MGVLWFVGRQFETTQSVCGAEASSTSRRLVAYGGAAMVEPLEGRVLLSAAPVTPRLAPEVSAGPPTIIPAIPGPGVTAVSSNPAGDIVTPGQNFKTFIIDYFSAAGIDNTTIGLDNLTVSGPGGGATGALNVVAFTIVTSTSTDDIVQYTFQKPDDSNFTPLDNGQYFVSTTATVKDLAMPVDTEVPLNPIDFFRVNIPDTTAPVATHFTANPIQIAGGELQQFTITYADDVAVSVGTVSTSNVTVTGPNGQNLPVISAVVTPPDVNGTPIKVTYTCQNSDGLWTAADNGTYFVSINNTLTDTSGNPIVPVIGVGTFTVELPDVSAPTVPSGTVGFAPPTIDTGDVSDTFTVTYNDNVDLVTSTLGSSNVVIIGPHGQAEFATFVSASPTTNATQVTATYSFTAPDTTTFTAADNGVYTFNLLSTVVDTSGNFIPAQTLGTLNLALNPADIARTEIGQFGTIDGKNVPLHFRSIPSGGLGTFRLTGGVGQAFLETSNSLVDLYIADSGGGVKLSITSSGAHPIQLGNVLINGTLLTGNANTSQLHGTFFATGAIQKLTLANVFGSVVAAGPIGTIDVVHGITGGEILSGVNLGSDGQFGGTGAAADSYAAGSISTIKANSIASTFIGAGISPGTDGQFGSSDDTLIGGSSSMIGFLQSKMVDTTSKFEAGSFGKAKFGNKFVNINTDTQFIVPLAAT